MKRLGLGIIARTDTPKPVLELARNRMRDFIRHYGFNILDVGLDTLVESAYLQGVEDAMQAVIAGESMPPQRFHVGSEIL